VEVVVKLLDVAHGALQTLLLDSSRGADVVLIGDRLHRVGGCWVARRCDPAVADPGTYRRDRIRHFMTEAEGARALAVGRRTRCRRCWPS
jgi:hypothetical protein